MTPLSVAATVALVVGWVALAGLLAWRQTAPRRRLRARPTFRVVYSSPRCEAVNLGGGRCEWGAGHDGLHQAIANTGWRAGLYRWSDWWDEGP